MKQTLIILFLFVFLAVRAEVHYSEDILPQIIQDIYEELLEEGKEIDFEELDEELTFLHEQPINLNATDADALKRLRFLTDDQIDAILLHTYRNPLQSIYELRLVNELADYEIRNLIPFVVAEPVQEKKPFYIKDMWHYGKHEILLRLDARTIENSIGDNASIKDPFYTSIKYKFTYGKRIEFGLVMERDPQEPFYSPGKTYGADFYGGWLQIRNAGPFSHIVAGDYHASFGQGLVINTAGLYGGKTSFLASTGMQQGLRSKRSTSEYGFLRGAGATVRLGRIINLTAFGSARKVDGIVHDGSFAAVQHTGYHRTESELSAKRAVWEGIVGADFTVRLPSATLGITISEHLFSDTLLPSSNYYNSTYFRGKRQFAAGFNYRWQIRSCTLFGEIATAQNTSWGFGNITGFRYKVTGDCSLTALYRYYSPHFDNLLADAFGANSRQIDENGLMIGADIRAPRHWHFSAYADIFRFSLPKYGIRTPSDGFDALLCADYHPYDFLSMQWKFRALSKAATDKYSLRYMLSVSHNHWLFKTWLQGNITRHTDSLSLGGLLAQQVEYHFPSIPIVLQMRAEAFCTDTYDNRFYLYENDVLHAWSVPMLYGIGGRWFLNCRYTISNRFSLYLKAAQTLYSRRWTEKQHLNSRTRTEVHALLRIRL